MNAGDAGVDVGLLAVEYVLDVEALVGYVGCAHEVRAALVVRHRPYRQRLVFAQVVAQDLHAALVPDGRRGR